MRLLLMWIRILICGLICRVIFSNYICLSSLYSSALRFFKNFRSVFVFDVSRFFVLLRHWLFVTNVVGGKMFTSLLLITFVNLLMLFWLFVILIVIFVLFWLGIFYLFWFFDWFAIFNSFSLLLLLLLSLPWLIFTKKRLVSSALH